MRLSKPLLALAAAFLLVCSAGSALAAKRVALLIGNAGYAHVSRLNNPLNDVEAMKAVFEGAGFDSVVTALDLGHDGLIKTLRNFADKVQGADVAVIYYSGHGLELNGQNYLVPIDAKLASDRDVEDEAVTLDRVMHAIDGAKRLKLVILDACRNNPFMTAMNRSDGARAVDRGLARVEPATADTLVAFAAKAGTTAADGDGQDSPFTASLAKHLVEPGLDIRLALGKVRDEVMAATSGRQEPFAYGSLGGDAISLVDAAVTANTAETTSDSSCTDAAAHWAEAQKFNRLEFYQEHLQRFGSCAFASFAKARIAELAKAPEPAAAPQVASPQVASPQVPAPQPVAPQPEPAQPQLALAVTPTPVSPSGAGTPITDCDRLAADPSDSDKVADGIGFGRLDGVAAVEQCRLAIRQYPRTARLVFQLGRGFARVKNFQAALQSYTRAANLGSAAALRNLGGLHAGGLGVPKDAALAVQLFQQAIDRGDRGAMFDLGRLYEDGNGVPQDPAKAVALYRQAIAKGDSAAMFRLASMFETGSGVPKDAEQAAGLYQKAIAAGNRPAALRLGFMYERGIGVAKDVAMALKLYEQAADAGEATAMHDIGVFYDRGLGVKADGALAADWVLRAIAGGSSFSLDDIATHGNDTWSPAFRLALETDLRGKHLYAGPIDGSINSGVVAALHALAGK